ncbi:MAG: hypothetical protein KDK28_00120 [Maritimibacter sp.]|nr:hypothetical protein [Maritimibacter sp.]
MVEERKDADRTSEDGDEAIAPEADPTLDIVRQMIVEAEAIPAPAQRPRGPSTPRPERGVVAPPAAAPAPLVVPLTASAPAGSGGKHWAKEDWSEEDWAEEDRAEEDWSEDGSDAVAAPEDWAEAADEDLWDTGEAEDDWDEAAYAAGPRSYGIVDPRTGERISEEWIEEGAETGPAARDRRPSVTGRLLGGLLRLVVRLLSGVGRLLWGWTRALATALWRRVAEFMRRPDAARRLALAIIAFSVFVWTAEVLWLTLLVPLAALITWASVGNEGCVELVVTWFNRLKARDAAKAERIRGRAAAVTRGLNRGLERLPQSWTQGLYLPDFETDGYVPEKLKVDPFEELAARVHSAKRAGEL